MRNHIAHATSNATTQPTVIPTMEPTFTVPLGFLLAAIVSPAEVLVVLLGAEVGVEIRSVDLQLIWIMGAKAVIASIVVMEGVERSVAVESMVSAGVVRAVMSGYVSGNEIMLAAESQVANVMTVEVAVSTQLAP